MTRRDRPDTVSSDRVPIHDETNTPGYTTAIVTHREAGDDHDHDHDTAPLTLPRTGIACDLCEDSRKPRVRPERSQRRHPRLMDG